jgi:signal transduction histidine kinase
MTETNSRERASNEKFLSILLASEMQVKRLTKLINNLLDVSRLNSKKLTLEREHVDLTTVTEEVIARFDETAKESGSRIRLMNGKKVVGYWDRLRIDQVATNLIANALKYGEGKPVTIRVDRNDSQAVLSVADKGIGISTKDEKNIFKRFVRTDSARKYGGLGLGLYIAKQIVVAHGGSIAVKSKYKEGSLFMVKLPLNS